MSMQALAMLSWLISPAAAELKTVDQGIKPIRTHIRRFKDGRVSCRFLDVPNLRLSYKPNGSGDGIYTRVIDDGYAKAKLRIWYKLGADGRLSLAISNLEFWHRDLVPGTRMGPTYVTLDGRPVLTTPTNWASEVVDRVTMRYLQINFDSGGKPTTFGMERGERIRLRLTYDNGQEMTHINLKVDDAAKILPVLRASGNRCE
ncbi:hypothetical protein [Sphingomonas soli]|uniref:hypothetical protein n=1 Tax=Sphingomonas soli TaxID=266127 RepID=UPI00082D3B51|nr:hypothetical protein [Sphingomonas soli]